MSVLVGREAPDFTSPAVLGDGEIVERFNLRQHLEGRYGLLFFYPLDFTFVCPSELVALHHRKNAFAERDTAVIGVSIDSVFTHSAWRNTAIADGGIGEVWFPLVSDLRHEISRAYGVESESGVSLRGAFLIDREGVVRAQVVHDDAIGRSIDELLRAIDACQFHAQHGSVCPAGWQTGEPAMEASSRGVASYLADHGEKL